MKRNKEPIVGIAWYRADQWQSLLDFCEDRENMEGTYEGWRKGVEKAMRGLRSKGQDVEAVDFDLEEFTAWCAANGKRPVAASRSEFTSLKLRSTHTS